jgi:hypothetical protein
MANQAFACTPQLSLSVTCFNRIVGKLINDSTM